MKARAIERSAVVLGAIAGALMAMPAAAQQYPVKPVRIVVTLGPGSAGDLLSRLLAEPLAKGLGQQVIVDNRPGAGGNVAGAIVAKSPPDGYNLFLTTISTHGINPTLYAKLPFDPIKDFAPITLSASSPNVLVIHPSMPVKTLPQLIAVAKSRPSEITYSSGGAGTSQHMSGELFSMMAGIKTTHVAYKATPLSMSAVLGGEVVMSFASVSVAQDTVKAGKLRGLGVTSAKRVAAWPDMATLAESGLPGFDVAAWFGFSAAGGTSPDIIRLLNTEFRKAQKDPAIRQRLTQQGMEVLESTPEEFARYIVDEIAKWGKVVKASGARVN
jgi:tripartite-type tricarboxylate transporter receptor subunit TctC